MKKYIILFFGLFATSFLLAQDEWESFTEAYTGQNSSGYVGPLVDVFNTSLNTGVFGMSNKKEGFHIELGVVGTMGFIGSDLTTFTATTESPFAPEQSVEAPTILGPAQSVTVQGNSGTGYTFPAGFDVEYLPLVVPQLRIGNLAGTDLTVRYFGVSLDETIEDVSLFGIGVRHNFGQYLPRHVIDINLSYMYQQFKLGDVIDATTNLFQLQVGQTLGIFNYYGVAGYQNGSFDLVYTYENSEGTSDINLNLDTDSTLKLGVGAGVKLAILYLHAEYLVSSPSILAVGLGLGI